MAVKKSDKENKTPISIRLIMVWMGYMSLRALANLVSMNNFKLNAEILGQNLAIFNYLSDLTILFAFIALIVLFVKRKKDSWIYFIILMVFLIIGNIIGLFYVDKIFSLIPIEEPGFESFVIAFLFIFIFLVTAFYLFLAYVVYRKRDYFKS